MSFNDWLTVIATLAAVVAATYTVIPYYFPREKPVANPSTLAPLDAPPVRARRGTQWIPIACVIIAWAAVAVNFTAQHWFSRPAPAESPIKAENARIDVVRFQPIINPQNQFFFNVYLANNGKSDASQWGFQGYAIAGASPDKDFADALFVVMRRRAKDNMHDNPMHVGQTDQWFSIPNIPPLLQLNDDTVKAYKDGQLPIFALVVLAYGDSSIPEGKHIYGEKCIYAVQDVIHNCTVHNREFIAD